MWSFLHTYWKKKREKTSSEVPFFSVALSYCPKKECDVTNQQKRCLAQRHSNEGLCGMLTGEERMTSDHKTIWREGGRREMDAMRWEIHRCGYTSFMCAMSSPCPKKRGGGRFGLCSEPCARPFQRNGPKSVIEQCKRADTGYRKKFTKTSVVKGVEGSFSFPRIIMSALRTKENIKGKPGKKRAERIKATEQRVNA